MRPRRGAIWVSAALLALAGCGAGPTVHAHTAAEPAQAPAALPPGWRTYRDYSSGLSNGIPRGWRGAKRGDSLLVRSPDRLVAVSVTADRTRDTLSVPLDRLTRATLAGLPGYRGRLRAGKPV